MTEGALRYRLKNLEEGPRRDGWADQPTALDGYAEVVEAIQLTLVDERLTGEGRPAQARKAGHKGGEDHSVDLTSARRHVR